MSELSRIKTPIEVELTEFNRVFGQSMKTSVPLLNIITNYILRKKGKQIRPILVFLTAKLNGEINVSTNTAASLIELLHTATLIHDDVVDESYERRGFFSINALWKSKVAVLLGDYLLAKGLLISVQNKEYQILEIVSDAVREMSEGELLQIQKARKLNITEEEYFTIINKKTATLIAACAASGARSVTTNPHVIENMKNFGLKLGIAFQIKDDLFDYEKNSLTGKPKGNDIQEKKLTLPLIHALQIAKESDRKHILKLINKKSNNRKSFNEIFEFVHNHQGIQYANERMLSYRDECLTILENYPESPAKQSLKALVNFIVTRNS